MRHHLLSLFLSSDNWNFFHRVQKIRQVVLRDLHWDPVHQILDEAVKYKDCIMTKVLFQASIQRRETQNIPWKNPISIKLWTSYHMYRKQLPYIFNIHRNPYINNQIYLHIVLLTFYAISLNSDLNHSLKNCK